MGGHSGRWASVRAAMLVRRGGGGPPSLFAEALPVAESFRSPRAWAFTLLGLDAYCAAVRTDSHAERVRHLLAGRLISIMASSI
jgi:hypothetical protein